MKGRVVKLEAMPSMHECTVVVDFGSPIGVLKCYSLLEDELITYAPEFINVYIEDKNARAITTNSIYDLKLTACFVNSYRKIEKVTTRIHHIENTHQILFQGKVSEVIEEDFICYFEYLDQHIFVEYEKHENDLVAGDLIEFEGEVRVEPLEEYIQPQQTHQIEFKNQTL